MALPSTECHYAHNVEVHDAVQPLDPSIIGHQSSESPLPQPTTSSQSLFQNARNVEVKDTQITAIANASVTINNNTTNNTINNTATNDPVSTILWPHVVAGAIFNSAARYGAGKCHPGTRKKIIERIVAWIEGPDPTRRILWIYGPAGAGKSAIAQTICELLKESHPDIDGGSFFFASGFPDRGNALKLFATLAYQLAIQFPSVRTQLNDVLFRDPSLPTKSMEIQLLSLIIQPLLRCQLDPSHSPVLVIDGLDECDNDKGTTQSDVVELISKSVIEYNIPLRFMILSRPEYWIRDVFDTSPLPDITFPLSLRDDLDADKDIKAYLTHEFERIRVENKRFMRSVVPPWPPTRIVNRLVEEASGQYIYAATVLKFVGNLSKFSNPQKQLDIIISFGPHHAMAFSELDRLYATILSAYPEWEIMKRVLAGLLLEANTTILTVVLGVDSDELVLVLDALSSLIEIKKPPPLSADHKFLEAIFDSLQDGLETMTFYHRSFREFLQDTNRSGAFHIDLDSDPVPKQIVNGFFGMVHRNLDQNYEIEPHVFLNIDLATYTSILPRTTALSILHCNVSLLLPLLTDLTAKLGLFDPGRSTHMPSLFYFIHSMGFLRRPLHTLSGHMVKQHKYKLEKPEIFMEFLATYRNLDQAIMLARNGALSALASCTDFKITPFFVYITEYHISPNGPPFHGLRTIADVADVISTLRHHRYILLMEYETKYWASWILTDNFFFGNDDEPAWRTQGAWRDLRISFAYKCLKSVLSVTNQLHPSGTYISQYSAHYFALRKFFDTRKISDIWNKEYFQNHCNLGILALTTDLAAWIGRLDIELTLRPQPMTFLVGILCWINRQLINPESLTLLRNHDKTYQQKMEAVMKYIFEHGFLKDIFEGCCQMLCAFSPGDGGRMNGLSTEIKVLPLPIGFFEEEMNSCYAAQDQWFPDWQAFHEEVFGKTEGASRIEPIIHPSEWHPRLVTPLLRVLVRFLYGQVYPKFSTELGEYQLYNCEELFPYIIQCLPYAHPTQESLDALRAIVYLYPQVTPTWNPPEGLWPLLVEFLQKYDPSILSLEEKSLFMRWLNSTEHADIKTYVDY